MVPCGCSPDYERRYNEDEGTIDLVCRYCSQTIAIAREAQKLPLLEEQRLCMAKLIASSQLVVNNIAGDPREQRRVRREFGTPSAAPVSNRRTLTGAGGAL
jgi:hypothetical protein